jgi:hypothetical protein
VRSPSSTKIALSLLLAGVGCATADPTPFGGTSREPADVAPPPEAPQPPPPSLSPNDCEPSRVRGEPVVYAHAALLVPLPSRHWEDHLAVFDPKALQVREWIPLESCHDQFVDMAVDAKGRLFMSGANGYFWFDPKTRTCTTIKRGGEDANGDYHYTGTPNNITFAPAKIFDPSARDDDEVLVGFGYKLTDDRDLKSAQSGYLRIRPDDADTTIVSPWSQAAGGGWWPSGDLVSVVDTCKGTTLTWATVLGPKDQTLCRACEAGMKVGLDCGDCLYEFDLRDGKFTRQLGLLPFEGVFGLAFWGGTLVGFSMKGKIFTIDPSASPAVTKEIPFALPPGVEQVSFMGAGSTTLAPTSVIR